MYCVREELEFVVWRTCFYNLVESLKTVLNDDGGKVWPKKSICFLLSFYNSSMTPHWVIGTLEGLLKLTLHPSRALNLASCILSGNPGIQRHRLAQSRDPRALSNDKHNKS